jgi:ATP phosphoribosyltransferase regulatory subunit
VPELLGKARAGYLSGMPMFPISQIPPGSQDLLAGDVRRRRRVQAAWFGLADAKGYEEVIPPTFEYEEVFTRGGWPDLASRLVRFVDQDGRIVALRADFTSSIARVVATRLAGAPLPIRLAYAGKIYRQEPEGGARRREIFQLGAELVGDASASADVEMLRLAIETMRALEIRDFQINLGDVRFILSLLAGLPTDDAERLRAAIDRRDRSSLAAAARELALPGEVTRALIELPDLIGRGVEVLDRAEVLATRRDAAAAVERLREIDALLDASERPHVVYDLGEIRGLGYYSGIRFELFVAGVGRSVGSGGRYDGLMALYGAERPAVGFALETDVLAELIEEGPR